MRYLMLWIALPALLCGCATTAPTVRITDAARYAVAGTKFPGNSTVYLFRGTSRGGAMYSFNVSLDKQEVGSFRREQYVVFPATEGPHQLLVNCSFPCSQPAIHFDADFEPNKTYYFVIEADVRFGGSRGYQLSTGVQQVDEPYALRLLNTYEAASN